MGRKGINMSLNLVVAFAIAMIVIVVSVTVYGAVSGDLTNFFAGDLGFKFSLGGGG